MEKKFAKQETRKLAARGKSCLFIHMISLMTVPILDFELEI
jgi:hypothetical protein